MLTGSPGRKKKPELIPIKPPHGQPVSTFKPPAVASKAAIAVKSKEADDTVIEKGGQKIPVSRDLSKLPGISISNARKKTQQNPAEENTEETTVIKGPVNPFSHSEFMEAWNKLAQNIRAEGKDSLFITLTKREPVVDDEFRILLVIDNKTQEQSLERDKQNMLEFLRNQLNNFALTLSTKIEEGNSDAFLYTSKEKFKRLAEKNPHLLLLQKRLNLDIDF